METMKFILSFQATLTAIVSIIALAFLYRVINHRAQNGKKKNPPQPKGAWPVIGHLHLLSDFPYRVLGNMADECGPIFTIKLGVHRALVVSNSTLAKECFTTNDKAFASKPKSVVAELMTYNYAAFGLSPYGDYWRKVRKIVSFELLSQKHVETLQYIRVPEVKASMKDIIDVWVRNKESTDSDVVQVEMKQWFGHLMLNMVVRTISGKRFSRTDEEAVRLNAVIRTVFELLGTFMVSDYFPYFKVFDLGGYQKAMKSAAADMDNILQGWLEEHRRRRVSGGKTLGKQDFLDALISIVDQDASEDKFPEFDRDTVIKATSLAILTAAMDTTSVTLFWALSLLLNNPEALKKAQDELDFHVGRERLVEESDIKNLVYLQAIMKETFRLYPAVPLNGAHESLEDCIVGGYNIPKGTRLITNLWKSHRDPNFWSDPNEFRPERFLSSQKNIDVKGQSFELLPFGSGRRMCPGTSFALQTLHLIMASLIQGFEIAKPSNEPIDMTEGLGHTIMKATPLEVLLNPRLSTNMFNVGA